MSGSIVCTIRSLSSASLIALSAVACGGGGGDAPPDPTPAPPLPAAPPAPCLGDDLSTDVVLPATVDRESCATTIGLTRKKDAAPGYAKVTARSIDEMPLELQAVTDGGSVARAFALAGEEAALVVSPDDRKGALHVSVGDSKRYQLHVEWIAGPPHAEADQIAVGEQITSSCVPSSIAGPISWSIEEYRIDLADGPVTLLGREAWPEAEHVGVFLQDFVRGTEVELGDEPAVVSAGRHELRIAFQVKPGADASAPPPCFTKPVTFAVVQ